mgnify:CR=1 FL=1
MTDSILPIDIDKLPQDKPEPEPEPERIEKEVQQGEIPSKKAGSERSKGFGQGN